MESPRSVADTVILHYFLLADQAELLLRQLGRPIAVPRIVFDPDEEDEVPEDARSELTRGISVKGRAAKDLARDPVARLRAVTNQTRLNVIHDLHSSGDVLVVDLDKRELRMLGTLTSPSGCSSFNLKFPLHAGEAACVAIAINRGLMLATDDSDALKALKSGGHTRPYQRVRKLLIEAAESNLISRAEANGIHAEMRSLGFWDTQPPFE